MAGVRVFVVLNEGSGTVPHAGAAEERARVAAAFAELGVEAVVVTARGEAMADEVRGAIGVAGSGRFDAVAVGGGDGSVSTVAGVLAGTAMPLGVLPLGTLNHFAKDLGLPLDLEGAARVIAAGHTRQVDVAEANGRVFVNNSSIGLYPYMVTDRERLRGAGGLGKWPAMLLAGARALRRFPVRRLRVAADGEAALPYRTPVVFVGNNAYEVSLFNPGARAALDRGELCLYVVNHRTRQGLLWLALRAAFGRLDQARDFVMRSGLHTVEIRARTSRLRVSIDGEIATMRPPIGYRTRPGALAVLAPAPAGQEGSG